MSRIALAVLLTLTMFASAPALAQGAKRSITQVAGDVYRFQNNFHFALVVVTEDGVVVSDPINAEAAAWLRANLKTVTDKPITHLIYSHSHGDHASGGQVLAGPGVTVIAHANAPSEIDGVTPGVRFSDRMSMSVGGKSFEMTWLGKGHGDDLIATVVRPENVAFIVDAASPKRLPYRDFPRSDIDGWIEQVKAITALDFEIFAPAHGKVGEKADAFDALAYMLSLRDQVQRGLRAGMTEDGLAASVMMDAYKDWGAYGNWRELNVRGMARYLTATGQGG